MEDIKTGNKEELVKDVLLCEGKTKEIYSVVGNKTLVIIENKDSITAFGGVRQDKMEGKAKIANATNAKIFTYLNQAGISTSFSKLENSTSYIAKKCDMVPIEFVARRVATGSFLKRNPGVKEGFRFTPVKIETFFKDDENNDPEMSVEQILESQFIIGGKTIGKTEINIMTQTTAAVFEILEKAWMSIGCALIDMKVEYGIDHETKQILLSDVIDNDSWRLWPAGDKRLMKDKQVYRDLPEVTQEALKNIKSNFQWVSDQLDGFLSESKGQVIIVMGSQSDLEHAKAIKECCKKYGITCQMRISSAHKSTAETLQILAEYEDGSEPIVYIAVAGRSNGLGPVISGNTAYPVINCPPLKKEDFDQDIWSSLKVPSGLGCSTVLYPGTAADVAASILGLNDHIVWSKVRAKILNNRKKILEDDRMYREKLNRDD